MADEVLQLDAAGNVIMNAAGELALPICQQATWVQIWPCKYAHADCVNEAGVVTGTGCYYCRNPLVPQWWMTDPAYDGWCMFVRYEAAVAFFAKKQGVSPNAINWDGAYATIYVQGDGCFFLDLSPVYPAGGPTNLWFTDNPNTPPCNCTGLPAHEGVPCGREAKKWEDLKDGCGCPPCAPVCGDPPNEPIEPDTTPVVVDARCNCVNGSDTVVLTVAGTSPCTCSWYIHNSVWITRLNSGDGTYDVPFSSSDAQHCYYTMWRYLVVYDTFGRNPAGDIDCDNATGRSNNVTSIRVRFDHLSKKWVGCSVGDYAGAHASDFEYVADLVNDFGKGDCNGGVMSNQLTCGTDPAPAFGAMCSGGSATASFAS